MALFALGCTGSASDAPQAQGVAPFLAMAALPPSGGTSLASALGGLVDGVARLGAPSARREGAAPAPLAPSFEVREMPPALTDAEIGFRLASDPESLGAMSLGRPNRGALFNARQMPEAAAWHVVDPDRAFGTDETLASIARAITRVNEAFAGTPVLYIGNLSSRHGGYLRPHRSHQSGRDADIGYYYAGGPGWYAPARASNLDVARTWALVKAFAMDPNVEAIFMDRSVQRILRTHAEHEGESLAWLDGIFEGRPHGPDRLIRHEWGHLTHLHVRFKCPKAQDAGARAHRQLDAMQRFGSRAFVLAAAARGGAVSRERRRSRS